MKINQEKLFQVEEIPGTWERRKLGEICFTTSGGTPSRKVKSYYDGTIPWVKSGELEKGTITQTEEYISQEGLQSSSAKIFPKGTLLIALYGATIGKLGFLGVDAATNQAICGIFHNPFIDLKFLKHFLFSNRRKLVGQSAGGAQPNISQTILKDLHVVIPPLAEQQRIVARIEELFSSLDAGVESLKKAQAQLKTYRQAVLKWAFEGRLTNPDVKDGELPAGWKLIKIGDCATVGTGATPLKSTKEYYENGNIPWVTSGALNDEHVKEATDFVTEKAVRETNLTLYSKQTLLLAMYGEGKTRGKCSELMIEACTNQAIAAICFEKHDVRIKSYLKYFLLFNYNNVRNLAAGGVQPNLNLGIVRKTLFPLPPTLAQQQQVVAEIETRLSVCDKLEESIAQSLKQAEALRQSILKKAFEGKLVPQDPKDEPASVLLERICVEREKAGSTVAKIPTPARRKKKPCPKQ
ncbi:MAG: restriction endonuclease subunit S [Candidatus Riflebacteria bacterium]|nr:restriction endonuclease subunit S [Candidatus Riflebacteria bacterium]